jgi:membrane associated rhomboid family serine protease
VDIFHLIGNLYFLIVFGSHVEDYIGTWRWLLLLLAATLVGDASLIFLTPQSTIPCIGASGGISGLLAFYALRFPHARLGLWFGHSISSFPAWGAILFWLLFQLLGAYQKIAGYGQVASLAHLGGALAGFLFWLAWRKLDALPVMVPRPPIQITRQ